MPVVTDSTCSALAYQRAMEHPAAGELLSREYLLFLSGRGGSKTDLLVHPELCRFADPGSCATPLGAVRQVSTALRVPDLAHNPKVTFTLCAAAPPARHLEFAAVHALGAAHAVRQPVVQENLGWALNYAARLGALPQARAGLWEQVSECSGTRFLRLAAELNDLDANTAVTFVAQQTRELSDRIATEVGTNDWSADALPKWWVVLPAAYATSSAYLEQLDHVRSLLLFRAPLEEVLPERPGTLLAWQVPHWFLKTTDGTGGAWPVMPVGADRAVDVLTLRTVAASGAEGPMVAQVARAAAHALT